MKSYVALLGVAVVVSVVALLLGRRMNGMQPAESPPSARPTIELDITITPDYHVTPAVAAVPKDHLVRLTVTNRYRLPVSLTLMGYQDRFAAAYVPRDSIWRGEFLADRPGEDFAWMLEGTPVAKLRVVGSHLVEGHR